jgi:hypothetical protein
MKEKSITKHLKHDIAEAKKSIAEDKALMKKVKKPKKGKSCGKR